MVFLIKFTRTMGHHGIQMKQEPWRLPSRQAEFDGTINNFGMISDIPFP